MKNFLSRLRYRYEDVYFSVKRKWQRSIRGYADSDLWNLDGYLAEHLYKMMDRFIRSKRTSYYPVNFTSPEDREKMTDEESEKEKQDWEDILIKIREGFKAAQDICTDEGPKDYPYPYEPEGLDYLMNPELEPEEHKEKVVIWLKKHNEWYDERKKVFEEGMDLLKKYFFALWD